VTDHLIARLLERSEAAIRAAERAAEADDAETAANRAYYAMFYAVSALLASDGVTLRRHSAVVAAFGERFVRTARVEAAMHRALLSAFGLRQAADYDPMATITIASVRPVIDDARAMLAVADRILGTTP
jgi:uncharacterized protein (UPF0332 family)